MNLKLYLGYEILWYQEKKLKPFLIDAIHEKGLYPCALFFSQQLLLYQPQYQSAKYKQKNYSRSMRYHDRFIEPLSLCMHIVHGHNKCNSKNSIYFYTDIVLLLLKCELYYGISPKTHPHVFASLQTLLEEKQFLSEESTHLFEYGIWSPQNREYILQNIESLQQNYKIGNREYQFHPQDIYILNQLLTRAISFITQVCV